MEPRERRSRVCSPQVGARFKATSRQHALRCSPPRLARRARWWSPVQRRSRRCKRRATATIQKPSPSVRPKPRGSPATPTKRRTQPQSWANRARRRQPEIRTCGRKSRKASALAKDVATHIRDTGAASAAEARKSAADAKGVFAGQADALRGGGPGDGGGGSREASAVVQACTRSSRRPPDRHPCDARQDVRLDDRELDGCRTHRRERIQVGPRKLRDAARRGRATGHGRDSGTGRHRTQRSRDPQQRRGVHGRGR